MTYFDHAASSPLYKDVLEILSNSLQNDYANPSSQHLMGHTQKEKLEEIRADFLKMLKADRQDLLVFTSSATESNNSVVRGLDLNEGDTVLFSRADHPSLVAPLEWIATQKKCVLKEIPLTLDGSIHLESFKKLLDDSVKLVALTSINNQNGVIHPIEKLALLVKENTKAHVHIDAVQSCGKFPMTNLSCIDSMSLTSHKIGGPKGIAGLFLKKNHKVRPLLLGGAQESGFRSGTEAFPLILAFHKALKLTLAHQEKKLSRIQLLSERMVSELTSEIPPLVTFFKQTSPYIISFILPGFSSDIVLRHLEMRGVYISSTSACSSKMTGFNASLFAMGIPENLHKNFLRISLGHSTTEADVERCIHEFKNVWNSIKHLKGK